MSVDERLLKTSNCSGSRYSHKTLSASEDYAAKGLMTLMERRGSSFAKSVEFHYFECLDEKKPSEPKI